MKSSRDFTTPFGNLSGSRVFSGNVHFTVLSTVFELKLNANNNPLFEWLLCPLYNFYPCSIAKCFDILKSNSDLIIIVSQFSLSCILTQLFLSILEKFFIIFAIFV